MLLYQDACLAAKANKQPPEVFARDAWGPRCKDALLVVRALDCLPTTIPA